MLKSTMLSINFFAEDITNDLRSEFMTAVCHESASMSIQLLDSDISRLETRLNNVQNSDKSEDEKKVLIADLEQKIADSKKAKESFEKEQSETLEVYTKVVTAMSTKNADGFGNHKDVVRTVLRVLASWDNSKLVKYAIIPAFQSPALYEALETIHVNSKASEDGATVMSKEVKEAYKAASNELETIIKTTFSLPFETAYTSKTRVKLTAEDKKLLHDCYIKGFSNKWDTDDETGKVNFKSRQIKTLVKAKKNKQSGKMEYDYSALASTISQIVIKHYFA